MKSVIVSAITVYVVVSIVFITNLYFENDDLKDDIKVMVSDIDSMADKINEQGSKLEEMSYHVKVLETIGVSIEVVQKPGLYDVSSVELGI